MRLSLRIPPNAPRRTGQIAIVAFVLALVLLGAGAFAIGVLPTSPTTALGWLALLGLGIPAWFALELLGDWAADFLANGPSRRVSTFRYSLRQFLLWFAVLAAVSGALYFALR